MGIYGEPDEVWAERINLLKPYQVNKHVMELTEILIVNFALFTIFS